MSTSKTDANLGADIPIGYLNALFFSLIPMNSTEENYQNKTKQKKKLSLNSNNKDNNKPQ